ncbi:MAG TPA: PBP1A family penicillin-binding protein [Desulfobacteraceae bacterium]|nr:PBP1A family penicillin-binding protein [Deltaproteobacteria bacterium]HDI59853.1 PBP1A family penicillin-binding protein [Desulfobacteraceae bacterium]
MTFGAAWIRRFAVLMYLLLGAGALGVVGLGGAALVAVADLPRVPSPLSRIIEAPPTEIFAATGERIMLLGGREFVSLDRVAPSFLQAVVATEDHRFWNHHGIDKLRIVKALWITLARPGRVEGASTITQQLAKNLFFSFERSWLRKLREMLVALQIEAAYDKRTILEAYVNQIPFGARAYGIEQASRTYFNKPAMDLTLAQSALLAGLPKSPTYYNPHRHPERAKSRQRIVLDRMVAVGYITRQQADAAAAAPLELVEGESRAGSGSYFIDWVMRELEQQFGPDVVYHGGLRVTTTLDPQMQRIAVEAVQRSLARLDETMGTSTEAPSVEAVQAALAAVESRTGAVKAMVGGRDYRQSEYNRAVQSRRQPGSGFKPFVYYSAMERLKIHPATVVVDRPVRIPIPGAGDWTPRNFDRRYQGPMILKQALMRSVNTISAQLVARTGPAAVVDTARRCGIESPLAPVYSVALGTSEVSPLEMAGAFATLATGGVRHPPFGIRRVEDAHGRVIAEHIAGGDQVLDPLVTYQLVDMLRAVVDQGTARVIREMGFNLPAAGKTGTTNNYQDAWFTGFTPTLSVCTWVGFDNNRPLRDSRGVGLTGGRAAAPIWTEFMRRATEGDPYRDFPVPDGIRFDTVDPVTGRPLPADAGGMRVALPAGIPAGDDAPEGHWE